MSEPFIEDLSLQELLIIRKNLLQEFNDAEGGIQNSLAFERHVIQKGAVSDQSSIQIIVMGGSNLVISLVEKINQEIRIDSSRKEKLPAITSKNVFLELIRYHLIPGIKVVGLNFAYPMSPVYRNKKLDGRLLRATKEHSFGDLIGNLVGEEVEKYIRQSTGSKIDVITANDIVCLIMSGLGTSPSENIVGGIVGTGFNFGFFLDDMTLVNLESGNFNRFTQSETGKIIDSESDNPGSQLWEKEVSGAYLYKHYNLYAEKFGLRNSDIKSTHVLSDLADGEGKEAILARQLLQRSAGMVAAQIGAIYDFKGKDHLTILVEGSLFWKGWGFNETVSRYLKSMGINENHVTLTRVNNSNILGAAHLVLSMGSDGIG